MPKFHLESVPVTAPLVAQQFHARRQIQLHLHLDLSHPWPPSLSLVPMADKGGSTTCRPPSTGKITAVATPNQGQPPGIADRRAECLRLAQVPCKATVAQETAPSTLLRGGHTPKYAEKPGLSGRQIVDFARFFCSNRRYCWGWSPASSRLARFSG